MTAAAAVVATPVVAAVVGRKRRRHPRLNVAKKRVVEVRQSIPRCFDRLAKNHHLFVVQTTDFKMMHQTMDEEGKVVEMLTTMADVDVNNNGGLEV